MFGRLYLHIGHPELPANEDEVNARRDIVERAPGARSIAVVFPRSLIKVRFLDTADDIWRDANSLVASTTGRDGQIGLTKVRTWTGPIQFPFFAHHEGTVSTLRIPRFDATVIEVGGVDADASMEDEPPFTRSDIVSLQRWIKANLS